MRCSRPHQSQPKINHNMNESILKNARILIVDDELANVRLLEIVLQGAGFTNLQSTTDARQALPLYLTMQPDLLLLDLHMPHLNGFEVMKQLSSRVADSSFLPILVLTADSTPATKRQALADGAKDFLTKPLDTTEVLLRINNLLHTRFQNVLLEEKVGERTRELEEAQTETLQRLALAAEYRDDDTGMHTRRVGHVAAILAAGLNLPPERVALIQQAAPLHDVGKIGISDSILLKPGKLTSEEFATMKNHTTIGAGILSGSRSPLLQLAEEIALAHHEKWDGSGYMGLAGDKIPLAGRIVAVADVFDALTHERPYKKAWPVEEAVAEIQAQSGRHFDPAIIEVFLSLPQETI